MCFRRDLIRRRLMAAIGPACERIDLPLHHAIGIVTCKTHLRG